MLLVALLCCPCPVHTVFYLIYSLPAGMYKEKRDNSLPAYKPELLPSKDAAGPAQHPGAAAAAAGKGVADLAGSPSAEMELAQTAPSTTGAAAQK